LIAISVSGFLDSHRKTEIQIGVNNRSHQAGTSGYIFMLVAASLNLA
jgi:hypothetical protein